MVPVMVIMVWLMVVCDDGVAGVIWAGKMIREGFKNPNHGFLP